MMSITNKTDNRFARGLSGPFMHELLEGRFRRLLQCIRDANALDLQLREHYISIYDGGQVVLELHEKPRAQTYEAKIASKYVQGVDLPDCRRDDETYRCFTASDTFVSAYLHSLPQIRQRAAEKAATRGEGCVEAAVVQASLTPRSTVAFIDRQVQVHGVRHRADLLGLTVGDGTHGEWVIAELKIGIGWNPVKLADQMRRYRDTIATAQGRLATDFWESYGRVLAQKRQLGLLPEWVRSPFEPPTVRCLFVLYDYNPRSTRLNTLRAAAVDAGLRAQYVLLSRDCLSLPPVEEWETL